MWASGWWSSRSTRPTGRSRGCASGGSRCWPAMRATAGCWPRPVWGEGLRLTGLGEAAKDQRSRLLARYPGLEQVCDVRAGTAVLGVELQRGPLGIDAEPDHPVSAVYICIAEEARGLETALALR